MYARVGKCFGRHSPIPKRVSPREKKGNSLCHTARISYFCNTIKREGSHRPTDRKCRTTKMKEL